MENAPRIRVFAPHEWGLYRELRLRALADSPAAFGSTLAQEQVRPPAEWERRLSAGARSDLNLPLVAEVAGEPAGLAWGRIEEDAPDEATLYQMWVALEYRRRGVGRLLLAAVIDWARTRRVRTLALGVTLDNGPAERLYRRAGFVPVGEPEALRPGSELRAQRMELRWGDRPGDEES